jgi:hypothetical protein
MQVLHPPPPMIPGFIPEQFMPSTHTTTSHFPTFSNFCIYAARVILWKKLRGGGSLPVLKALCMQFTLMMIPTGSTYVNQTCNPNHPPTPFHIVSHTCA